MTQYREMKDGRLAFVKRGRLRRILAQELRRYARA